MTVSHTIIIRRPGIVFTTLRFHLTYEPVQYVRQLHNTKLEWLASDKYFNLLGLFVSYEKKCCEYVPRVCIHASFLYK